MKKITKDKKNTNLVFFWVLLIIMVGIIAYFFGSKLFVNKSTRDKIYKIGILSGLDFFLGTETGFKNRMTELGYVEGKNIVYDFYKVTNNSEEAKKILQKFIDDKDDLIFVFPTNVAMQAKEMTINTKIPVVFNNSSVEGTNLVQSIENPGDNVTGVRQDGTDIAVKRYLAMRQLVPSAKRFVVFYQTKLLIIPPQLTQLRKLTKADGIKLIEVPADSKTDVQAYLQAQDKLSSPSFDVILLIVEPLGVSPVTFTFLAEFASRHNIPIGGAIVSAGGYESLFGVSTDNVVSGKQAAPLVDRILKGTDPGSISVITAQTFLQINLKAANKMGIKISDDIISQANKVIK